MSNEPATADASAPAPKKSKRLLIIATIALVLLGGGGAGAYFVFVKGRAEAGTEKKAEKAAEPEHTNVVALEPFVVNLADPGGTRFLRITPSLVVSEEHALEMTENGVIRMRVRSAILELLAEQTADHLVTQEGKVALKKAIAQRVAKAAHGMHVVDVLLSEFVVQF